MLGCKVEQIKVQGGQVNLNIRYAVNSFLIAKCAPVFYLATAGEC